MSTEGKARIAAAQRARWAKQKAAATGKDQLETPKAKSSGATGKGARKTAIRTAAKAAGKSKGTGKQAAVKSPAAKRANPPSASSAVSTPETT